MAVSRSDEQDRKDRNVADKPQPATTRKPVEGESMEDRKASRGDRYSDADSPGAEGNDPSHLAGKTFTRRVPEKPGKP